MYVECPERANLSRESKGPPSALRASAVGSDPSFLGVLLVGLFTIAIPAYAQDISIVPTLRAGDSFQLEVIRIRQNSAQPQQNGKSTTRVNVLVLSSSADGSVIEWVPEATVFDNPQVALNPLVGSAAQALRDIRFQLNLNADGELLGMANQAEVAPKLKTVVDAVVRDLAARIPEDQRKGFLDFIGQAPVRRRADRIGDTGRCDVPRIERGGVGRRRSGRRGYRATESARWWPDPGKIPRADGVGDCRHGVTENDDHI